MKLTLSGPFPIMKDVKSVSRRFNDIIDYLVTEIDKSGKGGILRCAIGYVQESGVQLIANKLRKFIKNGGTAEFIVGLNDFGTSANGLRKLLNILGPSGLFVFYKSTIRTFHPKVWLISNNNRISVFIGSSNLTKMGFMKNLEANIFIQLTKQDGNAPFKNDIEEFFKQIRVSPYTKNVNEKMIERLKNTHVFSEDNKKQLRSIINKKEIKKIFSSAVEKRLKEHKSFLMTLSKNDVATTRYEPYFLIPIKARNFNKKFWGWDSKFRPSIKGKHPERRIKSKIISFSCENIEKNRLYYLKARDEFRYVSKTIYNLGIKRVGHLLLINKVRSKIIDYRIEIVSPKDKKYNALIKYANNISSAQKMWGYL